MPSSRNAPEHGLLRDHRLVLPPDDGASFMSKAKHEGLIGVEDKVRVGAGPAGITASRSPRAGAWPISPGLTGGGAISHVPSAGMGTSGEF